MKGNAYPGAAGSGQSWPLLLSPPRYLLIHSSAAIPPRHVPNSQLFGEEVFPSPRANSRSVATLWWTTKRNIPTHTYPWAHSPSLAREHRAFHIHLRKPSQYRVTVLYQHSLLQHQTLRNHCTPPPEGTKVAFNPHPHSPVPYLPTSHHGEGHLVPKVKFSKCTLHGSL